jgi:hypothetical protein
MVTSVVLRVDKGVSVSVSLELKFNKYIYTVTVPFTISTSVRVSFTSKRLFQCVNISRALHKRGLF